MFYQVVRKDIVSGKIIDNLGFFKEWDAAEEHWKDLNKTSKQDWTVIDILTRWFADNKE